MSDQDRSSDDADGRSVIRAAEYGEPVGLSIKVVIDLKYMRRSIPVIISTPLARSKLKAHQPCRMAFGAIEEPIAVMPDLQWPHREARHRG